MRKRDIRGAAPIGFETEGKRQVPSPSGRWKKISVKEVGSLKRSFNGGKDGNKKITSRKQS